MTAPFRSISENIFYWMFTILPARYAIVQEPAGNGRGHGAIFLVAHSYQTDREEEVTVARENTCQFAILGMLCREPLSGYDLRQAIPAASERLAGHQLSAHAAGGVPHGGAGLQHGAAGEPGPVGGVVGGLPSGGVRARGFTHSQAVETGYHY
ncbi:hypothetical protein KYC5002_11575 [Archangium violaceum]|uniref:hypothetical protein n=1 Tax=Archangium violaceum TaxID=83451 RepID=UPI002B286F8C|nr:hypothetical protein KYC5002_11575 [Archangium gephyra]